MHVGLKTKFLHPFSTKHTWGLLKMEKKPISDHLELLHFQVSEEEISFLTKGEDPYDDSVVRKLFHPNLKLLLVTEGPNGCRYYTKVRPPPTPNVLSCGYECRQIRIFLLFLFNNFSTSSL